MIRTRGGVGDKLLGMSCRCRVSRETGHPSGGSTVGTASADATDFDMDNLQSELIVDLCVNVLVRPNRRKAV